MLSHHGASVTRAEKREASLNYSSLSLQKDEQTTHDKAKGAHRLLQTEADSLSKYNRDDYSLESGVGETCLFFDTPVYRRHSYIKAGEGHSIELAKAANNTRYIETLETWAGKSRTSIWISDTLPVDLNLPLSTRIPDYVCVQAFVLSVGSPPILLTVYDPDEGVLEETRKKEVFSFTMQTVRLLSRYLHRFGYCNFVLLPCTLSCQTFTEGALKEDVESQITFSRRYFHGPNELTEETFDILRKAALTRLSMSYVPCFLLDKHGCKEWVLLLDADWLKVLTRLIEAMNSDDGPLDLTWSSETEDKVKVAVLEAARRLSCMEEVDIFTEDEGIMSCIKSLKDQVKKEYRGLLTLKLEVHPLSGLRGAGSQTQAALINIYGTADFPQTSQQEMKPKKLSPGKDFKESSADFAALSEQFSVEEELHSEQTSNSKKQPTKTIAVFESQPLHAEDIYQNYFENRRSGGGIVEAVCLDQETRTVHVTFQKSNVSERVADRTHKIGGHSVKVELYRPPRSLPTYPRKLMFQNIPENISRDHLKDYLELVTGLTTEEIVYSDHPDTIVVTFTQEPDVSRVQKVCQSRNLCGKSLTVARVPVSTCVMVENLAPSCTEDTLLYYFENKRIEGGTVERVEMDSDTRTALVWFEDYTVVDNILKRSHCINKKAVQVKQYIECLGPSGGSTNPSDFPKPKSIVVKEAEKLKLDFIRGSKTAWDQTREQTGMPTLSEISRKIDGLARKVDELLSKVDALKYPIPPPPPPPPPPAPVQHQGNKQGAAGRKEEEATNAPNTSSSNSEEKKAPSKLDVATELRQFFQSGGPALKKRQRSRKPEEANGEENQSCAADESQEEKELKAKLAVRRRLSETDIDTEESKPEVDEPEYPQPSTPTLQLVTEEPKEEEG